MGFGKTLTILSLAHWAVMASAAMAGGTTNLRSSVNRLLGFEAANSAETYYAEEAQAWRMLGVYTDCEGEEDGAAVCQRYLLWAAYVDEDYSGEGQGEYMFYNAETSKWDKSACELTGSSRCVRMNCHLPNTHFKLLGYYKQYDVTEFLEQLFDHQGSCTWTQNKYNFMENSREAWPQGCTQSGVADEDGTYPYYDVAPLAGGRMSVGLYSDEQCSTTYPGSLSVEEVLQANNSNGGDDDAAVANQYGPDLGTEEWVEDWNSALDTYRTCQPCMVSKLSNNGRRRLDEGAGDNPFTCQDAAGYEGANQCSMFALNTEIQPASFRDIRLATLQGTIVSANAKGITTSSANKWWRNWGFFTIALLVFVVGLVLFCCFVKVKKRSVSTGNEPLLGKSKQSSSSSGNTKSTKSKKNKSSGNK